VIAKEVKIIAHERDRVMTGCGFIKINIWIRISGLRTRDSRTRSPAIGAVVAFVLAVMSAKNVHLCYGNLLNCRSNEHKSVKIGEYDLLGTPVVLYPESRTADPGCTMKKSKEEKRT
jgi:hypothetical protein